MKPQELTNEELKNTNGGSILGLGNDNNTNIISIGGSIGYSHTDDDGQTSSSSISYGNQTGSQQSDR